MAFILPTPQDPLIPGSRHRRSAACSRLATGINSRAPFHTSDKCFFLLNWASKPRTTSKQFPGWRQVRPERSTLAGSSPEGLGRLFPRMQLAVNNPLLSLTVHSGDGHDIRVQGQN